MSSSTSQLRFIAFRVSISVSVSEKAQDDQLLWRPGETSPRSIVSPGHFFAHPTLLNWHDARKAISGLAKGLLHYFAVYGSFATSILIKSSLSREQISGMSSECSVQYTHYGL